MKSCEYGPSVCIHKTSFYSYLTNRPSKLECLSVGSLPSFLEVNTLADWAFKSDSFALLQQNLDIQLDQIFNENVETI